MIPASEQSIVLIGHRGSGKSTVGRLLAVRMDRDFLDADDVVQARAGMTISEIFTTQSESYFRELESQILQELATKQCAVISLGAGAVEDERNRERIARMGWVVWLSAPADVLHHRVISDAATATARPSLTADDPLEEIRKKLACRAPWYEGLADLQIDTTAQRPEQIAEAIQRHYSERKSR
jgi:shikimate kinase